MQTCHPKISALVAIVLMVAPACTSGSAADSETGVENSDSGSSATSGSDSAEASSELTGEADTSSGDGDEQGDGDGDGERETTSGDGDGDCPADPDSLLADWIDGTDCGSEPEIQVHRVDDNTYLLRQSLCSNFEGPFLYLLFGDDTVLLEDTGAGGIEVAELVYGLIDQWLRERGQAEIELLVLNSHGHGDHVAGNGQFEGQPGTTVVGTSSSEVADYFGITDWPNENATIDLGGRSLELLPIPGHQSAHVALYDSRLRWLMTGDTLYPGRLYISDFATYVTSIEKLVTYTESLDVCAVMGTHVEMTQSAGDDFMFGATSHPNEHGLALTRDHLVELRDGVVAMGSSPTLEVHDDFIIYPL